MFAMCTVIAVMLKGEFLTICSSIGKVFDVFS